VGHLPEPHHLGAVALGASTFAMAYLVFSSVRMGTTGLTAQAVGAGDGAEARACLVRPLGLALLAGLVVILLGGPIVAAALFVFDPTPAVAGELAVYIGWRVLGAPAALATFVLLGWLLGNHDTRSQFVLLVVPNAINAVLNVVFVFGFGWGVAGVAIATVIAEYAAVALGLVLARRRWRRLPGAFDAAVALAWARFRRLFRVNGDLVVRSLFLETVFLGFAALSARQGEVLLAANAVLLNMIMLQAYALDGFAFAAEALAGRAVGRRSQGDLDAAFRAGAYWSVGFALLIALVFAAGGGLVIALLTGIGEVRAAAGTFLVYVVVAPLVGAWAYLFDGIFSGATQTRELRNGSILAAALFFAVAFPLTSALDNHGLWLALLLFLAARAVWLGWRYRRLAARAGFVSAPT
ncbi:MAG: MATE family efflux transporter, partial [Pseudomonadota bacterium]